MIDKANVIKIHNDHWKIGEEKNLNWNFFLKWIHLKCCIYLVFNEGKKVKKLSKKKVNEMHQLPPTENSFSEIYTIKTSDQMVSTTPTHFECVRFFLSFLF